MEATRRSSKSTAAYALAVLMIASVVSLVDRQILSLLLLPIRTDLELSDTGVSLLQGVAFAAVYAFAGLPIGRAVDRYNRRNIIIAGVTIWSVMTALCGFADSFWALFLARVGVGMGEACLHPAAYSLISDYFPPERRGRAYSLFGGAATIGISVSLFAGAAVIAMLGSGQVDAGPFGSLAMWKAAFLIASLPGFVVVLALLFMREPPRLERAETGHAAPGFLPFLRRRKGVISLVFAAYGLINFAGYGVLAWMAAAYVRVHGLSLPQAGFAVGGIMLVASIAGALLGGTLADRWSARGLPGGRFRVVVMSGLGGALAFTAWWGTDHLALSFLFGTIAFTMQVAATSTAPSVIAELAPNDYRGQLSAVYLLVTGLGGVAAGPTLIALVADYGFGTEDGLRYAMIIVPALAVLGAAALAWRFRHYFSQATAPAALSPDRPHPAAQSGGTPERTIKA